MPRCVLTVQGPPCKILQIFVQEITDCSSIINSAASCIKVSMLQSYAMDSIVCSVPCYSACTSVEMPCSYYNSHCEAPYTFRRCSAITKVRTGQLATANSTGQCSATIVQDSHVRPVPQGSTVMLKHCIVTKAHGYPCNTSAPISATIKG